MQTTSKEARINLAIEAIRTSQNLSIRKAAKLYNIPHITLTSRMNRILSFTEHRSANHKMTELKKKSLLQYILDIDERGFSPRINDIEDIANYIFKTQVGRYRMLVLDGHESYKSPAFQEYCKEHNIILLSLLSHSSYLTQPLNIDYFGPLKYLYNQQIENFIKVYITHITKTEFFQAFKAVYIEAIPISNGKAGFRKAGLIPFNPEIVLSKLDIRIRTSSNRSISIDPDIWQSQIFYNPIEAFSQFTLMKSRITQYQGSSSTPIFKTITALAKGIELLAYTNTLLAAEVHSLYKANKAFSKHQKTRKALIQKEEVLSVEDKHDILEQENIEDQI
ncbi:hypothetical protein SS1G_09222 [Sclerotinia sclerotiorum 1980 UF-70]|uniref:HTH psq-type domain-containing protein n=1 Tax=Sclerotinia sclerotiorum (strain ATCC 18683 / 1980 / Ss-1) TaxID=665079 RepID=A7EV64_SCLS1|nr:hypothetical protein SS1G_09222 [Sclerotinia sclerotiorum 1980 UF-70]EDN93356.1 hypothetical protein SS1G_09222 [Sclerotinia sclerotiorum 1980 UF-70]